MKTIIHTDNGGKDWAFSLPDEQADIIARFLWSVRNLGDYELTQALQQEYKKGVYGSLKSLQEDIEHLVLTALASKYPTKKL